MPQYATAKIEPFLSFERGIDLESSRTSIEKGGYEAAQNMLLSCVRSPNNGSKHMCTAKLDQPLDSVVTWPSGNTIWATPYTFSTFTNDVLAFSSHFLIARTTGQVHRYDFGAPGTNTNVRRGFDTTNFQWTDMVYDQWLVTMNGRDAPMKYGQHFRPAGEARPFLFPLGSKPVSPMGAIIEDENWTFSAAQSAFVDDASVPSGGSRVHTQSVKVAGGQNAFNSWDVAKDFLTGPYPYGGTDFAGTDFLVFQVVKPAGGAANIRIRFGNDADTAYFEFTQSVDSAVAGWQTFRLLRSTAATTGAPVWSTIKRVTFFNDDATQGDVVYLDDVYFLYGNAPPAFQVACEHKTRIVGGGVPVAGAGTAAEGTTPALANLYWSRAAFPDEFPAENVQLMSSGRQSLSRANMITTVREFGASVLVGTPHAILAWTINGVGVGQKQTVTNELGIDSHRACIETPNAGMIFLWQRGIYVIRASWRAYGGEKVRPLFKDLWLEEPQWSVAVFDEITQSIRFWWREKVSDNSNPGATTAGIVCDYVRAQELGEGVWPSTVDQLADFACPAYINGVREIVYGRFGEQGLYRLGTSEDADTSHYSFVTLPWMSRETADKLVKWEGLVVPYSADQEVTVKIRYADSPGEFKSAGWEEADVLPATQGIEDQGRVLFGKPSRWAQVQFEAFFYGMEIFAPISKAIFATSRQP